MAYDLCFLFQFFDDVRDVIRKAPAKELVDLPEGHDAKLGKTLRVSYVLLVFPVAVTSMLLILLTFLCPCFYCFPYIYSL